jgi:L-ascorbate metabolism protein UlaG (beta-lactamase superfamily)
LRYAGFTILTDPNFLHAGDHVHLGYGLTSERLTEPAINIEDLPPVDLCVLPHYHGDHFDQIVEEKLDKDLPIVTTNHAVGELEARDFRGGIGLDTWETAEFIKGAARLRITSLPGKHGPAMVDFALPDVMGSILDFETETGERLLRLYISGDTLIFDDLKEIPNRFPEIDLALIHLGGTRILGVMLTMDDKQGVEIIQLVRPEKVIPIHYNDYDVFKSPLEDFKRAVEEAGLTEKLIYLSHGETYNFEIPSRRRMKTSGKIFIQLINERSGKLTNAAFLFSAKFPYLFLFSYFFFFKAAGLCAAFFPLFSLSTRYSGLSAEAAT